MEEYCHVCGSNQVELHHIIKRSKVPALRDCKKNFIYLCPEHHRGTRGVHGKNGQTLERELRLKFQNKLEMLFDSRYLIYTEIKCVLEINDKSLKGLLKCVKQEHGFYERESLLIACMGGKLEVADE